MDNVIIQYNSNINNRVMQLEPMYPPLPEEEALLNSSINAQEVSSLDTGTMCKVQIVGVEGAKVLKSILDKYGKLRIVLLALLTRTHLKYTEKNQQILNVMKKLVLDAELKSFRQRGIQKQQLLKLFFQHLRIPIGPESQNSFIRLFNCGSFFQEILMEAVLEADYDFTKDLEIQKWAKEVLDLELIWNNSTQSQNQIALMGIPDDNSSTGQFREYLCISNQVQNMDMSSLSSTYCRESMSQFLMSPMEKNMNRCPPSLYMSIESVSPSLYESKQNFHKMANSPIHPGLFESVTFGHSKRDSNKQQDRQSKRYSNKELPRNAMKVRRSGREEESSTLWNILCCGLGRS